MSRMPRETDVCSQMLTPSPISSESDIGSSQNSEQKSIASIDHAHGKLVLHEIDLRVNGIPNDEIYDDKQYMQSVTKQIEKIVDVEKSLQDESLENNILSVEAAMNIYEPDNCELHEVPRRTVKEQCPSCQSNVEAGFQVCSCGGKLDMTEDMLSRIRRKIRELIEWCSTISTTSSTSQRLKEE